MRFDPHIRDREIRREKGHLMTYRKYTPELLAEAAAQSRSIAEVLRVLGLRASGGC